MHSELMNDQVNSVDSHIEPIMATTAGLDLGTRVDILSISSTEIGDILRPKQEGIRENQKRIAQLCDIIGTIER